MTQIAETNKIELTIYLKNQQEPVTFLVPVESESAIKNQLVNWASKEKSAYSVSPSFLALPEIVVNLDEVCCISWHTVTSWK